MSDVLTAILFLSFLMISKLVVCLLAGLLSSGASLHQRAFPPSVTPPVTSLAVAPTVTLNTTILQASGDWILVSWAHVINASCSDFLALLPASSFLHGAAPGVLTTSPAKLAPTNGTSDGSVRCVEA